MIMLLECVFVCLGSKGENANDFRVPPIVMVMVRAKIESPTITVNVWRVLLEDSAKQILRTAIWEHVLATESAPIRYLHLCVHAI